MPRFCARFALWFAFALLVCAPTSLHISSLLIGSEEIDVWNHAWGYWYVADALSKGYFPLKTLLVGAPEGGTLYYIDSLGAFVASPITLLFGPAVAYNLTLLTRIALSALAAQYLCEELSKPGIHSWIAGVAYASTPFLLCELANGISEVCATQWIAWTMWALARVLKRGTLKDWMILGVLQGITTTATFYYGLTSALLIVPAVVFSLIKRFIKGAQFSRQFLIAPLSALVGLAVLLPHGWAFWESIHSDDRLVLRDTTLNDQLLRHNAVDPAIFITPGHYQSVDLLEQYGEPFIHTAYLRWSVILLVLLTITRGHRGWFFLGVLSLTFGMGSYLWVDGGWFLINDQMLSLPFDWLRQVLPQIAITHPLRLSIAAQAIFAALSGVGILHIKRLLNPSFQIHTVWIFTILIAAEGLFGSSAKWPLPAASAEIPKLYEQSDTRAVLDLPAEVGTTMKTSRYFWMQTKHQSPIPYTPDVRVGSARDFLLFKNFIGGDGISEDPRELSSKLQKHLKRSYGLIVLHGELDSEMAKRYEEIFTPLLGPPVKEDLLSYWVLPKWDRQQKNQLVSQKDLSPCEDVPRNLSKMGQISSEASKPLFNELLSCSSQTAKACMMQGLKEDTSTAEALLCAKVLRKEPQSNDIEVLIHLLRRNEQVVRMEVIQAIKKRQLSPDHRQRLERFYREERIPDLKRQLQGFIPPSAPK
ncbi:MAG: hypothetical protein CMK59_01095 [Proteobacteria bacterium]|nr:hypothetical protein [Pseudomonadota bacterium]